MLILNYDKLNTDLSKYNKVGEVAYIKWEQMRDLGYDTFFGKF